LHFLGNHDLFGYLNRDLSGDLHLFGDLHLLGNHDLFGDYNRDFFGYLNCFSDHDGCRSISLPTSNCCQQCYCDGDENKSL
jgi:hypothetical protein